MLPVTAAHRLGVYNLLTHSGARTSLVFAEHIEIMTGMTRQKLALHLGLPTDEFSTLPVWHQPTIE